MNIRDFVKFNAHAFISSLIGLILIIIGVIMIKANTVMDIVIGIVFIAIGLLFIIHMMRYHWFRLQPPEEDHSFSKTSHSYENVYREQREPMEGNF